MSKLQSTEQLKDYKERLLQAQMAKVLVHADLELINEYMEPTDTRYSFEGDLVHYKAASKVSPLKREDKKYFKS